VSGPEPSAPTHIHTRLGHPRVHLRCVGSTNERARELALAGAPHGTLVTASAQSAGRGRQGRRWSAPAGSSLLMSLLLREVPTLLPLIAAVAVSEVAGPAARIKWPNDVVLETTSPGGDGWMAKLAGILVEGRLQAGWAVLGIGLNVAVRLDELPSELQPDELGRARGGTGLPAASMGLAPADVEPVLARLIAALERWLSGPDEATLQAWRERDALRGREVAWAYGRGRAEGIDGTGRLIVALAEGGRTALGAGEVHLQEIA
jgi:BirA family biotin operon repressor/biotin-[acetyl-CoA-carboxylase] ligase